MFVFAVVIIPNAHVCIALVGVERSPVYGAGAGAGAGRGDGAAYNSGKFTVIEVSVLYPPTPVPAIILGNVLELRDFLTTVLVS